MTLEINTGGTWLARARHGSHAFLCAYARTVCAGLVWRVRSGR